MTPEQVEQNRIENDKILKAVKKFVDNSRILIAEGNIVFGMYFGEASESLVLTPHQAKRFSMLLAHQITNYESTYGTIPAAWAPASVESPIQPPDLQNPPEDSGSNPPNKPKGKK